MAIFGSLFKHHRHEVSTAPKSKARQALYNYYVNNDYPEIPAIPDEPEAKMIIEQMELFPNVLVPRDYMRRIDGEKRGNIVFLWWLSEKGSNLDNYPRYFLFEYGLDMSREIPELIRNGYISDGGQVKAKGLAFLDSHSQTIREHKAHYKSSDSYTVDYSFDDKERVLQDVSQRDASGKLRFQSTNDVVEDQMIGRSYERNQDYENAILAYKSALSLSAKDSIFAETPPPNIFNRLAIIYRKLKRYSDEIAILDTALAFYPENEGFRTRSDKARILEQKLQ